MLLTLCRWLESGLEVGTLAHSTICGKTAVHIRSRYVLHNQHRGRWEGREYQHNTGACV